MADPEIHIAGEKVNVVQADTPAVSAPVKDFVERIRAAGVRAPSCGILPPGTRAWIEHGDRVAVCVEVPPHARTVHWIADDSPEPSGEQATYARRFLAFPYVEILLVFMHGALTGAQQLFYRSSPLTASDQALLLPNLLNVSPDSYGQRAWLCLVNLRDVSALGWHEKLDAISDHVFSAAFNRSSEISEGSSYWGAMHGVDPRVASVEAWECASRENPRFALDVAWKLAGTTVDAELESMLATIGGDLPLETATDLSGVLVAARARTRRRRRCFPSF